jgi:hypothetical protein
VAFLRQSAVVRQARQCCTGPHHRRATCQTVGVSKAESCSAKAALPSAACHRYPATADAWQSKLHRPFLVLSFQEVFTMIRIYAFALAAIVTCAAMEAPLAWGQSNDRPPGVRSTAPWATHPFETEQNLATQTARDFRQQADHSGPSKGIGYEFGEGLVQGLFAFVAVPRLALQGGGGRVWSETLGNDSWIHVSGFILGCFCLLQSAAKYLR